MEEARTVAYSMITLTELMIPAYANFGGKIHGGILLSLMDKVAYACSSKHSGAYCVTVSVDNVEFLEPVEVGEMVSLKASINYVGNTSMLVGIRVISENFLKGTFKHTNTCYFTMVAKDSEGKPTKVPALILETKDEVRRFIEATQRKKLRNLFKENLDNAKTSLKVEENLPKLAHENCIVNWKA